MKHKPKLANEGLVFKHVLAQEQVHVNGYDSQIDANNHKNGKWKHDPPSATVAENIRRTIQSVLSIGLNGTLEQIQTGCHDEGKPMVAISKTVDHRTQKR